MSLIRAYPCLEPPARLVSIRTDASPARRSTSRPPPASRSSSRSAIQPPSTVANISANVLETLGRLACISAEARCSYLVKAVDRSRAAHDLSNASAPRGGTVRGPGGGIMHPMFVTLFLETDDDDLLAEEEARRRAALRRKRPALAVRAAARERSRG